MSTIVSMLLAWLIALIINVVPAFMPPTWSILAVFRITAHPPLLLLTVGGAAMSALGRMALALLSRRLGGVLPESDRKNAQALGGFIRRHRNWQIPIVFGYCLAPFPSNPIFIAAGVGRVPLVPVTLAFFASRAIADTFWVWTADRVSGSVGGVFLDQLTSWQSFAIQFLAIVAVVLVFRLPWLRWFGGEELAGQATQGEAGVSTASSQSGPTTSARKTA